MRHAILLFEGPGRSSSTTSSTAQDIEQTRRDHWPEPPARYQFATIAIVLLVIAIATLVSQ